jgi:hypothetical protein
MVGVVRVAWLSRIGCNSQLGWHFAVELVEELLELDGAVAGVQGPYGRRADRRSPCRWRVECAAANRLVVPWPSAVAAALPGVPGRAPLADEHAR